VAVVQVDRLNTQALQALLACRADVFRIRTLALDEIRGVMQAKLGGEEDVGPLARPLEPSADLVLAVSVDVGRVPEALANLMGAVEDSDSGFGRVLLAIEAGNTHGAEADGCDGGAVAAEGASGGSHDSI